MQGTNTQHGEWDVGPNRVADSLNIMSHTQNGEWDFGPNRLALQSTSCISQFGSVGRKYRATIMQGTNTQHGEWDCGPNLFADSFSIMSHTQKW